MADETIVAADSLRTLCDQSARVLGVEAEDAAILADNLVEADLRGVHTHGSSLILGYSRRLRSGGTRPRGSLTVVHDAPSVAVTDGEDGIGQIIASRAMRLAIEKARRTGIGAVSVRHSNHFGAAASYSMMALPHDMIGFATTNAGARIPPVGGASAVVGNNPLSYAIPAGIQRPIVLDMAQSVVAAGKIGMALRKGESIPLGWALDRDGRPTEDPREGLAGLLLPIAGPKGFGLALVMDALSGGLSAASVGLDLSGPRPDDRPAGVCHYLMAIDVASFVPVADFKARIDKLIGDAKAARKAPDVEEIYMPGEIEYNLRDRRLREGIPLLSSLVGDLEKLAVELDLPKESRRLSRA